MKLRARPFIAALALATLLSREARADDEAALPYLTLGLPFLFGGMLSDTVQWGIFGTTNASTHWAWHMIPLAGPVIGFTAFDRTHCGNEPQCSTPEAIVKTTEAAYFASELAGIVLVGVGLYKRTQPRYTPPGDVWLRITPTAQALPGGGRVGVVATF
jgi:hypothetical protein